MITDHLPAPRAILFDLDGTLADTAPDLAAAINLLRARAGLAPTPYDILRPTASAGARGMIGASYGVQPGESGYEALKDGFLNNYEAALAVESRLFDGIPALLDGLQTLGLAWGVVTNKAARFTDPLVGQIGLGAAGCVISGDTMAHPKPHPAPLLEAARRLELAPQDCWYVGDDLRDIQAAKAAGMPSAAAAWGYIGHSGDIDTWGASIIVAQPLDLLQHLGR